MNRKSKSLKQIILRRNSKMFCGINSYKPYSNAVFQHCHSCTIVLPLVYCRRNVVQSRPRNPLSRCVKSLLLLQKPHSWS